MEDYCTLSPDGTWGQACKVHDESYKAVSLSRELADSEFYINLKATSMPKWMAWVYFKAVRIFGRLVV